MNPWVRRVLTVVVPFFAPFFIAACDQNGNFVQEAGLEKLNRGVSSEADVRNAMGEPDTVWEKEDGERTLEYPKGPAGARTWMFYIGKDGKLSDYKQVLTEENFARIKVGMRKEEVRQMLGRPRTVVQFKRKNEEVWDWRYTQSDASQAFFNVHMDITSGLVTGTSVSQMYGH
ncbi:Beta-barrel assembly machine subunit BamE [Collimonas sp. OK607]|uniref:outer membrane protein assembly factor BamE domain-containing protein n=1 Tax=Collimonas sp. OK607 TaxID=1798194 RepID=UPI0008EA8D13|nr:outer membrane protein assembly factor BamE [Collimonas sp. OK607]SFB33710.1 Beta-barrel assembly machine subunit BamE [Collimonas sp. OK607]